MVKTELEHVLILSEIRNNIAALHLVVCVKIAFGIGRVKHTVQILPFVIVKILLEIILTAVDLETQTVDLTDRD